MEFSSQFSDDLLNFRIYSRMDYMYMYLHRYTEMHITWKTYIQWSFQIPKLEVLYHLKPYFGHSPHIPSIDLTYSGHLQFGYLKCPLIYRCTGQRDVAQGSFTESTYNPDTASPLRISTLLLFFNEFSPFQWVFSEFSRHFVCRWINLNPFDPFDPFGLWIFGMIWPIATPSNRNRGNRHRHHSARARGVRCHELSVPAVHFYRKGGAGLGRWSRVLLQQPWPPKNVGQIWVNKLVAMVFCFWW